MSLPSSTAPSWDHDSAKPTAASAQQTPLSHYITQHMHLNAEQQEACFASPNAGLQVLAGAGTGKTLLIAARFLYLLETLLQEKIEHPESRILVLTFTHDAAREMRHRIQHHLTQAGHTGPLPHSTVTTFHAFCQQLLLQQDQAVTSGMRRLQTGAAAQLVQGQTQRHIQQRVIQRILTGLTGNIATTLRQYNLDEAGIPADILSLAAIQRWPVPQKTALIQALPAVVERIKAAGLSPLAFYQCAQQQTQQWSDALAALPQLPYPADTPIHWQDIAQHWKRCLKPWATPQWLATCQWDDAQPKMLRDEVLARFYKETDLFNKIRKPADHTAFRLGDDSATLAQLRQLTQWELHLAAVVAAFYALYQQTLSLDNALDFNDLIAEASTVLQSQPSVAQAYRDWFRYVLVDEFQDTNGAQLTLLRQLLALPPQCNLTVVGDEKQSIYGFRYAQKENLRLVFEHYTSVQQVALKTNYRSVPAVLQLANHVTASITNNQANQQLQAFRKPDPPSQLPAVVWLAMGRPIGQTAKGTPRLESAERIRSREDAIIVQECVRLVCQEGYCPSDIAILLTRHSRADSLAQALEAVGLPYLRSRDAAFFQEPCIKNATAVLRLLADANDSHALVRLVQQRLNPVQVFDLLQVLRSVARRQNRTLLETLAGDTWLSEPLEEDRFPAALRFATQGLGQLLWHAQQDAWQTPVLSVVEQVMNRLMLTSVGADAQQQQQEQLLLKQWQAQLAEWLRALGPQATAMDLWEACQSAQADPDFELTALVRKGSDETPAIRLMTIHGSKGLEFPVVFALWSQDPMRAAVRNDLVLFDPQFATFNGFGLMARLEGEPTPLKWLAYKTIWQTPRELAEAERRFYVAITRAKQRLYVFTSATSQKLPACSLPLQTGWDFHSFRLLDEQTSIQDAEWIDTHWPEPVAWDALRQQVAQHPQLAFSPESPETSSPAAGSFGLDRQAPVPLKATSATPGAPLWLSFSALKALSQCHTQYWWLQVAQLREETLPTRPQQSQQEDFVLAALRGQVLHRAIEQYYRLPGQAMEPVLSQLVEEAFQLYPHARSDSLATLQNLFSAFSQSRYGWPALQANGWRVIAPELPIVYRWPTRLITPLGGERPIFFRGRVDALFWDSQTETYHLVDFKTNHELRPAQRQAMAQQLWLYQTALKASNPQMVLPDEQVYLLHLTPDGQQRAYSLQDAFQQNPAPGRHQFADFWEPLARMVDSPVPPKPGVPNPPCLHCAYSQLCPEKENAA